MNAGTPFRPLAMPGDIVWSFFPRVENMGTPGPKPRPALVLFISEEDHAVMVAYGTTQRTDKLYPGEFVMDPRDPGFELSGLSAKTKFDVRRTVQLYFTSTWFKPAPGVHINSPLPKLGTLHPTYVKAVEKAYNEIH